MRVISVNLRSTLGFSNMSCSTNEIHNLVLCLAMINVALLQMCPLRICFQSWGSVRYGGQILIQLQTVASYSSTADGSRDTTIGAGEAIYMYPKLSSEKFRSFSARMPMYTYSVQ